MTPEDHNELLPALEAILKEASDPLDCNQLYDMQQIRAVAPSANRVSDYLGILFRKGKVSFGGIIKEVNLYMVPEAKPGDYVLVHVGAAISVVDEAEAKKAFDYLKRYGTTIEATEFVLS